MFTNSCMCVHTWYKHDKCGLCIYLMQGSAVLACSLDVNSLHGGYEVMVLKGVSRG